MAELDQVADATKDQSPAVEQPAPDPQATEPEEDIATWKRRLAGKDQALTTAKKAAEEFRAKYEELAKWKAAQEEANLSEFEKAERRAKDLERELENTRAEFERERLKSKYPTYFDFSERVKDLDSEARAAEFEKLMKSAVGGGSPEISDANSPKRTTAKEKTLTPDGIKDALRAIGNPWAEI
jgi:HD-GYP domain-containing protein (c-di-GMP phosphodiesterase class II)